MGLTNGFCPKMTIIPTFFLANIGNDNVFHDILERENSSLGYKNKQFKKSKNCDFSKGVNPWFWSKNDYFSKLFFFQAIQARKMSFTIFYDEKTPFQAIKTQSSKSRNIDIFPKGLTRGFGPKKAIFLNFFFCQYRQGKCLLRYFTTKKLLSWL